jgi:hypothetical protein
MAHLPVGPKTILSSRDFPAIEVITLDSDLIGNIQRGPEVRPVRSLQRVLRLLSTDVHLWFSAESKLISGSRRQR